MDRGEINVDPVHDEFFKAQDLADALVREAIQNSLDARRGRSTVRVRFRFAVEEQALPVETAAMLLQGLGVHLDAVGMPVPEGPMPFLVVEDSGTRGLTGDPGEDPELDPEASGSEEGDSPNGKDAGAKNDFYYFWRNVGRSGKSELDRGRWGLGKAVFPVSSRIRTMFGLTLRADDNRTLLMGQAVLKTHILDGRRNAPYGFFAHVGRDAFPHALDSAPAIARFIEAFGLQRSEPGLSIVVPFHRQEDLRFEQIVASVIRQYFYPITRGDLVVSVAENGVEQIIRSATIDTIAAQVPETADVAGVCALTRWSVTLPDSEWIAIPDPPSPGAPKWRDDVLPPAELEALRHRFEAGDRLAFRVELPIRRKKSRAASSHFAVILEKDETLRRGEHHFIRRGITIPEVKSVREKPVRALLIADHEALSTFLGDAENPAHSDWSERSDKVRTQYEQGASTLRYVKRAIETLAALVSTPPAGRDAQLLASLFSVDVAKEGSASAPKPQAGHGSETAPAAAPARTRTIEQRVRLTAVQGGFSLHGSGALGDVGVPFAAEVAYRTRNGNPFRKYSAFDFRIGSEGLTLSSDGLTIRRAEGNRLEFVPASPDFHLALTGFDPRRDLVVRVTRKDDDAPEAELH